MFWAVYGDLWCCMVLCRPGFEPVLHCGKVISDLGDRFLLWMPWEIGLREKFRSGRSVYSFRQREWLLFCIGHRCERAVVRDSCMYGPCPTG